MGKCVYVMRAVVRGTSHCYIQLHVLHAGQAPARLGRHCWPEARIVVLQRPSACTGRRATARDGGAAGLKSPECPASYHRAWVERSIRPPIRRPAGMTSHGTAANLNSLGPHALQVDISYMLAKLLPCTYRLLSSAGPHTHSGQGPRTLTLHLLERMVISFHSV